MPRLSWVRDRLRVWLARIDRAALAMSNAGFSTFAWPLMVALSFGLLIAAPINPLWISGLVRHRAVLQTQWPSVATMAAAAAAVTGILAIATWWKNRKQPGSAADWLRSVTRRWCWLAALPVVIALSAPVESLRPSFTIVLCLAVGSMFAYSAYFWLGRDFSERTGVLLRRLAPGVVAVCTIVYVVVILWLSIVNHFNFNTNRADLGFYMSTVRLSSLGQPLACSICVGGTHVTGHFDPILVLLSPLYLLYPFSETLLVLQTVWLASGVVPVYALARHHTQSPLIALALSVAYLAYPALHGVNLFDFHSLALAIPVLLWVSYCFETERLKAYAVLVAVALLVREDISLALVCFAAYAFFSGKPKGGIVGISTLVAAVLYFVFVKGVMMSSADPLNVVTDDDQEEAAEASSFAHYFGALMPAGGDTSGLLGTLLTDPFLVLSKITAENKLEYAMALLGPLFFLPLLGRGRIRLAYGAFITLVAQIPPVASINYHYSSLLIPFLFALGADALGRLHRGDLRFSTWAAPRVGGAVAVGIVVTTLLASWKFGAFWPNESFRAGLRPQARSLKPALTTRAKWLRAIAWRLPRDTSITAATSIVPHLGRIRYVYYFGNNQPSEYVIYSSTKDAYTRAAMEDAIKTGRLVPLDRHEKLVLYRNLKPKEPLMRPRPKAARRPKIKLDRAPPRSRGVRP